MQFGKVTNPELIDFTLPEDHMETARVLAKQNNSDFKMFVGCAKWNKQDLKGFYPKGTKDELTYYSRQFNSIELNATFYKNYSANQYETWYQKTPQGFKFFPKLVQDISHFKGLDSEVQPIVEEFLLNASHLKEKLGTIFLQMHTNFSPNEFDKVIRFIEKWPKEFKLAIELRHTDWFNDPLIAKELYNLLEENNVSNVLVDTAGRRDIMHMRMTNSEAFIRYVGANHQSDYTRLDDWILRILDWKAKGIEVIHFFVHQNDEVESPLLSKYFIQNLNQKLSLNLKIPKLKDDFEPLTLF